MHQRARTGSLLFIIFMHKRLQWEMHGFESGEFTTDAINSGTEFVLKSRYQTHIHVSLALHSEPFWHEKPFQL